MTPSTITLEVEQLFLGKTTKEIVTFFIQIYLGRITKMQKLFESCLIPLVIFKAVLCHSELTIFSYLPSAFQKPFALGNLGSTPLS